MVSELWAPKVDILFENSQKMTFCFSQSTTIAKMTFSYLGEQPIKQGFHVLEQFAPTGSLKLIRFPVQRLPKLTPHLKTAKNDLFPYSKHYLGQNDIFWPWSTTYQTRILCAWAIGTNWRSGAQKVSKPRAYKVNTPLKTAKNDLFP